MVSCGSDVRNDRHLAVRLLAPLHATLGAERRARTVRSDQKLAFKDGAAFQGHADRRVTPAHAGHARGAMQRDARRVLEQAEQTQSDVVQLNNLTQGINPVILRVQRDKACMSAIADVNGPDRRSTVGNRLPDPNAGKLLAGALRQRNGAGIKTGVVRRLWRNGFYQVHRKLALRHMRNGQRQRGPGHAAAHDNHAHARAAAISASISSAFFTTLAVRFSLPVSVITISSSIRMPIPRYSSGTSASGAM